MEELTMKFVAILILNVLFFGVISALSCVARSLSFFYFGFIAIVSFLSGSICYFGWLIHNMGYWPIWFLILPAFISIAWVIWEYFFINIPADPPSIGILTIWGERKIILGEDARGEVKPMTVEYCREGLRFYCPYFPFFVNYNKINVVKRNKEFVITVWCKRKDDFQEKKGSQMGVQMEIKGSYTWTPDLERLYQFLQTGEDRGVDQIFPDVLKEEIRKIAQENYWEDFLGLQKAIINQVIKKLTNEDVTKNIVNGLSDVQEIGILLYRLNVKSINLVDKDLIKSVTAFSRETRERQAEIHEMETETAQALILVNQVKKTGKEMSFQDAYALIKRYKLAREGKMDAKHFSFEGIDSIVSILEGILSKK